MPERVRRHPLSGFEYDLDVIADRIRELLDAGELPPRLYDEWSAKRPGPGRRYLLTTEVELAAWRVVAERLRLDLAHSERERQYLVTGEEVDRA